MNVRYQFLFIGITFSVLILWSCVLDSSNYNTRFQPFTDKFTKATGYRLLEPSETYILPEILTEISGLSVLNDSTLACVQDEKGVIFLFGLNEGNITDRFKFEENGDFEGIEIIGDQAYVLKSNGKIYRYSFYDHKTEFIETPLKGKNNAEGLSFDPENNRLLIACKGNPGLEGTKVNGKAVYSFHLTHGFNSKIAYLITQEDLQLWNQAQPIPFKMTERRKNFMLSAIAVHPLTNEVYLLANVGKLLMVLGPQGEIRHCVPLSPRVFRQPEGICFTSTGDLVISNEGQDGSGKILVFRSTE
jgi:uncharacterized protein YjiK